MIRICNKYSLLFFFVLFAMSCSKDNATDEKSSVKIVSTVNAPVQVKLAASSEGNLLVYSNSEEITAPAIRQELFILNPAGEVLNTVFLSDTIFQFIHAIAAVDGGFFLCASSNTFNTITLYHLDDTGAIVWWKRIPTTGGSSFNGAYATVGADNNYLVMFQSFGSGYYIWKGDALGNEIFNKKIPIPNANHQGTGLIIGEKYSRLIQANDTLIVIQGVTMDMYSELIENCFLRTVDQNIVKKFYSTNYDSTHIENGAALFSTSNQQILFFGTKSGKTVEEGFGDYFVRKYSLSMQYLGETNFARINGTPTLIRQAIEVPGGGYMLAGSNNQLPSNDVVSNNHIVLARVNSDLTLAWTREIKTEFPAKGYDLAWLPDGTLALIGLLKQDYATNVILYLHMNSNGDIINN